MLTSVANASAARIVAGHNGRARNAPKFDLRAYLFKMCGVDLTRVDGIDVTTALAVLAEIGADLSKFPSVKHFTSWLGVCPGDVIPKISSDTVSSPWLKMAMDLVLVGLARQPASLHRVPGVARLGPS